MAAENNESDIGGLGGLAPNLGIGKLSNWKPLAKPSAVRVARFLSISLPKHLRPSNPTKLNCCAGTITGAPSSTALVESTCTETTVLPQEISTTMALTTFIFVSPQVCLIV